MPKELIAALKEGGKMIIPVGDVMQSLLLVEKMPDGSVREKELMGVRYVPLVKDR